MSLMKLLSVSKSFADGTNQSGRYKMAHQGLLPKFAPMGRTVSLAPKRTADETRQGQVVQGTLTPPMQQPPQSAGAADSAGAVKTISPTTRALVCPNASAAAPRSWFRLGTKPLPDRAPARPKPLSATQTARSLDAVKPVRNDLSDSDLQIVPVKAESHPEALKSRPARWLRPELTGLAWSRLTARFFSSDHVRA